MNFILVYSSMDVSMIDINVDELKLMFNERLSYWWSMRHPYLNFSMLQDIASVDSQHKKSSIHMKQFPFHLIIF